MFNLFGIENFLLIEYKIRKDYCNCCERALDTVTTNGPFYFKLSIHKLINSINWSLYLGCDDEVLEVCSGYMYDVIEYEVNVSGGVIIIDNNEKLKVVEFINRNFNNN